MAHALLPGRQRRALALAGRAPRAGLAVAAEAPQPGPEAGPQGVLKREEASAQVQLAVEREGPVAGGGDHADGRGGLAVRRELAKHALDEGGGARGLRAPPQVVPGLRVIILLVVIEESRRGAGAILFMKTKSIIYKNHSKCK